MTESQRPRSTDDADHGHHRPRHRRGPPWGPPGAAGPHDWRDHGPPTHVRRRFLRTVATVGLVVLLVVLATVVGTVAIAARLLGDGPTLPAVAGAAGLLVVVVAVLVAGAMVLARRVGTPLADVVEGAERVRAGEADVRVTPSGPREVRRLATTFNDMAARLDTDERRRRALLADLAHELRTPLSVVRGTVEGIVDGVYEPTDDRLDVVVDELAVMERLLDDLATLSTAEAGALRLEREDVAVADLVTRATGVVADRAAASGVVVDTEVAPDVPDLEADPLRLEQVLVNLLANAVRHTPAGGRVEVVATRHRDDVTGEGVRIRVTDTGTGIDPDDLPHVFERYHRSADSGGSGLGLAIAHRLVTAHGGAVGASPRPGGGTVMTVDVPTAVRGS